MNNVNLIGRLTKDAQIVEMKSGNRSVINFILAVNKDFTNEKGKEKRILFLCLIGAIMVKSYVCI